MNPILPVLIFFSFCASPPRLPEPPSSGLKIAVEFTDHAAGAYIARAKGWYEAEGLKPTAYDSYITGMALAAALARGDVDAAFICLVPAINAYANAGVPLKIVAGTHRYGYGLVVNPRKVRTIEDLEKPEIRLGCVREGGAVDVLLRRAIDKYQLDENKIIPKTLRMNPPQLVLALESGQLDAAFLPEHHATVAESLGFLMLLRSQDIWPGMQGSVLLVKESLLNDHPETVKKLVGITREATAWINEHPGESAAITASALQVAGENIFPQSALPFAKKLIVTPRMIEQSMKNLDYSIDIDPREIQATINYLINLGYLKTKFPAEEILDLRFLQP